MTLDEWVAMTLPKLPPISDEAWQRIAANLNGTVTPAEDVRGRTERTSA